MSWSGICTHLQRRRAEKVPIKKIVFIGLLFLHEKYNYTMLIMPPLLTVFNDVASSKAHIKVYPFCHNQSFNSILLNTEKDLIVMVFTIFTFVKRTLFDQLKTIFELCINIIFELKANKPSLIKYAGCSRLSIASS